MCMNIKKGDTVIVLSGKDKGKRGLVERALPREDRVVVAGVNVATRSQKARRGKKGQIVEKTLPVHVSNVALIDPKSDTPTRIKIEKKDGKRMRMAVKSGEVIK